MTYHITIRPKAIKILERINAPFYSKIKDAIYSLANEPRPDGYIKLKGRDGYRIRVGQYRVIYDIHDDLLLINVISLGHRKDVYE